MALLDQLRCPPLGPRLQLHQRGRERVWKSRSTTRSGRTAGRAWSRGRGPRDGGAIAPRGRADDLLDGAGEGWAEPRDACSGLLWLRAPLGGVVGERFALEDAEPLVVELEADAVRVAEVEGLPPSGRVATQKSSASGSGRSPSTWRKKATVGSAFVGPRINAAELRDHSLVKRVALRSVCAARKGYGVPRSL